MFKSFYLFYYRPYYYYYPQKSASKEQSALALHGHRSSSKSLRRIQGNRTATQQIGDSGGIIQIRRLVDAEFKEAVAGQFVQSLCPGFLDSFPQEHGRMPEGSDIRRPYQFSLKPHALGLRTFFAVINQDNGGGIKHSSAIA